VGRGAPPRRAKGDTVTTVRPRRSALYVPGSNARALAKAAALAADVVVVDLEDAVAPAAKEEARRAAVAAIGKGLGRAEVVLRVNGADGPWGADDLVAAARSGADAVLLPKVERASTVVEALARLEAAGAPASLALWAMLETPRGILRAEEVASSSPRLACLVAGTSDLVKDLRARHTPGRSEVLASLSWVVLAARAAGLAALDGVHLDLDDPAGFERACRQGRDLGFDGKTLIHPRTIDAANLAFTPGDEELALARRVIDAHAEAEAAGRGVVVVDGRLVEALHVAEARRVVALASAIQGRAG
jgi:citrate lyase subunit beta / citryl-CoA lyase